MALKKNDLYAHLMYHVIRAYGRKVGGTWLLEVPDAGVTAPCTISGDVVGEGLVLRMREETEDETE